MKIWLVLLLLFTMGTGCSQPDPFKSGTWIDLTHDFSSETVYWPTAESFRLDTVFYGQTDGGFFYSAFQYCAAEHGGTHLDAPVHFAAGRQTVDQIPLDRLIGPAAVVDVSSQAAHNRDYLVTTDDLQEWEKENGALPEGSILFLRTGFGKFWPIRAKYMGTDQRGSDAVADLHFPGLDPAAAEWLIKNRSISAVGLDTPSIDHGPSKDFKSHQVLFGENVPAFENVANLDRLPATGAYVIALPMKIKGGSGGPLRIVAWLSGN